MPFELEAKEGVDAAHVIEAGELIFAVVCGCFLLTGWLLAVATDVASWVPRVFYIGSYIFGGYHTARGAIDKIIARRFEIDFLMLVAAAGAATLGAWAEGALLLFFFSLGHSLEHYAMGRARRAIEALAELVPQTALIRRDRGSDVALETADVALMADDLDHLPFVVGLSRQTSRIIRQNLWVSLGMVVFLVPATVFGLQMGAAVLFHEGSTLLVVFNALRLLTYGQARQRGMSWQQ